MDLTAAIAEGAASPVLLIGMALLLGALHGLEPGHSKTMMAAFIIAVRGTVGQAALLGVSAAASHSLVVWALALLALAYGNELIGEALEPWLLLVSGVIILLIALWVLLQTLRARRGAAQGHERRHHDHHHHDDHHHHGPAHAHAHHDHAHRQDHAHAHAHTHAHEGHGRPDEPLDAHARAHAAEIETRFASGKATLWQTILFGLGGGLIPCSAAITVLILCLHLQKFWLGVGLVAAFSAGLALTLVAAGVLAAIGMRYASSRSGRLDRLLRDAPFLSAAVIGLIGLYMIGSSWAHLAAHHL